MAKNECTKKLVEVAFNEILEGKKVKILGIELLKKIYSTGICKEIKKRAKDEQQFKVAIKNIIDSISKHCASLGYSSENIYWIARSMNEVSGCEEYIQELAENIIYLGQAQYIYKFALNVKNAPINELLDAIINTKDEKYMLQFMLNIECEKEKLRKAILENCSEATIVTMILNQKDEDSKYYEEYICE